MTPTDGCGGLCRRGRGGRRSWGAVQAGGLVVERRAKVEVSQDCKNEVGMLECDRSTEDYLQFSVKLCGRPNQVGIAEKRNRLNSSLSKKSSSKEAIIGCTWSTCGKHDAPTPRNAADRGGADARAHPPTSSAARVRLLLPVFQKACELLCRVGQLCVT
jgi:hypothetical protein